MLRLMFWLAAIIGFLFALDRLFLYLESRGWIYYRKKKPSPGSVGNAFLEIQQFLEPSKKYVVQIKKEEKRDQQGSGDLPPESEDLTSEEDEQ